MHCGALASKTLNRPSERDAPPAPARKIDPPSGTVRRMWACRRDRCPGSDQGRSRQWFQEPPPPERDFEQPARQGSDHTSASKEPAAGRRPDDGRPLTESGSAPRGYRSQPATQAAQTFRPDKAVDAPKLACPVSDLLAHRQSQPVGNAVVADRLGREPYDQTRNIINFRHIPLGRCAPERPGRQGRATLQCGPIDGESFIYEDPITPRTG